MINSLLKFKKKIDNILKNCFNDDALLTNALKESFESFINSRGNKPAELLAKFIDSKLRVSITRPSRNAEVDMSVLNSALVLFRYIQSKDAFEAYYKRFLAKRLLLDRSVSDEIETHVLEKLKLECGYEFTKNLETMFKDTQISNELNTEFKGHEKKKARLPINVKVIAQATWPTYPNNNIRLPQNVNPAFSYIPDIYLFFLF
jgi:cullin-4